jgi:hypothetical protein
VLGVIQRIIQAQELSYHNPESRPVSGAERYEANAPQIKALKWARTSALAQSISQQKAPHSARLFA